MIKLLVILFVAGVLANGFAKSGSEPPLLIDPSQPTLDASH
jgi:hypothetical protein